MRKSRGPALVFDSPSDMMAAVSSNSSRNNRYSKISLSKERIGNNSSRSKNPFDEDDDLEQQQTAVDSSNPFSSQSMSSLVEFQRNETLSPIQPHSLLTATGNSNSLKSNQKRLPLPPPPLPPRTVIRPPTSNSVEMVDLTPSSGESKLDSDSVPSSSKHDPDEDRILRFLVSKRVYGFPGGSTSTIANYWRYFCNNHPFFSMCFAHRLHPFGKKQRFLVFLNGVSFAIFISFVFFETTFVPRMAACRLGCNPQPVANSNNTLICEGGYNNGLNYNTYSSICRYYQPWELSAICGLFIVIYQSFLEFIATCACIQGRCTNCFCSCSIVKRVVECCGGTILTFFTIITTFLLLYAILACYYLGANFDIFGNILLSKLWSIGEWFIWSAPYFIYRYPLDRQRYLQKLARKSQASTRVTDGSDHLSTKKAVMYATDALNMFVG